MNTANNLLIDWQFLVFLNHVCKEPEKKILTSQEKEQAFFHCKRLLLKDSEHVDIETLDYIMQFMIIYSYGTAALTTHRSYTAPIYVEFEGENAKRSDDAQSNWASLVSIAESHMRRMSFVRQTVHKAELSRIGPCTLSLALITHEKTDGDVQWINFAHYSSRYVSFDRGPNIGEEMDVFALSARALLGALGTKGESACVARDAIQALGWSSGRLLVQNKPIALNDGAYILQALMTLQSNSQLHGTQRLAPEILVPLLSAHLECCLHDYRLMATESSYDEEAIRAVLVSGVEVSLPPELRSPGRTLLATTSASQALVPAILLASCLAEAMQDIYCQREHECTHPDHERMLSLLFHLCDLRNEHVPLVLAVLRASVAQVLNQPRSSNIMSTLLEMMYAAQRLLQLSMGEVLRGLVGVASAATHRTEALRAARMGHDLSAEPFGCALMMQLLISPASAPGAHDWLVAELHDYPLLATAVLCTCVSLLVEERIVLPARAVLQVLREVYTAAKLPETVLESSLATLTSTEAQLSDSTVALSHVSEADHAHQDSASKLWANVITLEEKAYEAIVKGGKSALLAIALRPAPKATELAQAVANLLCASFEQCDDRSFEAACGLLSVGPDALAVLGAEGTSGANALHLMPLELSMQIAISRPANLETAGFHFPRRPTRLSLDLALSAWPSPLPGSASNICSMTLSLVHALVAATQAAGTDVAPYISAGLRECLALHSATLLSSAAAAYALGLALRRLAALPTEMEARRQSSYVIASLEILRACAKGGPPSLSVGISKVFDKRTEACIYRALLLPAESGDVRNAIARSELIACLAVCFQYLDEEQPDMSSVPSRLQAVAQITLAWGRFATAVIAPLQSAVRNMEERDKLKDGGYKFACDFDMSQPSSRPKGHAEAIRTYQLPTLHHVLKSMLLEDEADANEGSDSSMYNNKLLERHGTSSTDTALYVQHWLHLTRNVFLPCQYEGKPVPLLLDILDALLCAPPSPRTATGVAASRIHRALLSELCSAVDHAQAPTCGQEGLSCGLIRLTEATALAAGPEWKCPPWAMLPLLHLLCWFVSPHAAMHADLQASLRVVAHELKKWGPLLQEQMSALKHETRVPAKLVGLERIFCELDERRVPSEGELGTATHYKALNPEHISHSPTRGCLSASVRKVIGAYSLRHQASKCGHKLSSIQSVPVTHSVNAASFTSEASASSTEAAAMLHTTYRSADTMDTHSFQLRTKPEVNMDLTSENVGIKRNWLELSKPFVEQKTEDADAEAWSITEVSKKFAIGF